MHNARYLPIIAGASGAAAIVLGALGAHLLKPYFASPSLAEAWQTAVLYHLVHAVALLAISQPSRSLNTTRWPARFWVFGTLLFSGSLYCLALGGPRWLGPVTPLGGLFLIAGWVAFGLHSLRHTPDVPPR